MGTDLLDMQVCGGASARSGDMDGPIGKPLFHERDFHLRVHTLESIRNAVVSLYEHFPPPIHVGNGAEGSCILWW